MSAELAAAVRAVLEAARAWRHNVAYRPDDRDEEVAADRLIETVDALEALMPTWSGDVVEATYEGPHPWGKVLAGDEALGADGKWYRVVNARGGNLYATVTLDINGAHREYRKDSLTETTIRRTLTPEAAVIATLEAAGIDVSTVLSKGE